MAEIKKIATRESYGNALKELASEGADKLVVLDADLSAATKTGIQKPVKGYRPIPTNSPTEMFSTPGFPVSTTLIFCASFAEE